MEPSTSNWEINLKKGIAQIMHFPPNLSLEQKEAGTEVLFLLFKDTLSQELQQARDNGIEQAISVLFHQEIISDGSDYEIAQLRFREKLNKALQDLLPPSPLEGKSK